MTITKKRDIIGAPNENGSHLEKPFVVYEVNLFCHTAQKVLNPADNLYTIGHRSINKGGVMAISYELLKERVANPRSGVRKFGGVRRKGEKIFGGSSFPKSVSPVVHRINKERDQSK